MLRCNAVMRDDEQLEELWRSAAPAAAVERRELERLPAPAQRYFERALTLGEPRASAVRLEMHGEIRLGTRWDRFEATQVIRAGRGFVWRASIRTRGLRVSGSDRWVDGAGLVRWKLFGLLPLVKAGGSDISRSSAGRAAIECVWLPGALLDAAERFEELDGMRFAAHVRVGDVVSRVVFDVDGEGRLVSAGMLRWGTPDGVRTPFRAESFGCVAQAERRFGAHTIPTELRVGWYYGTPFFDADGEFFRCVVTNAEFR